MKHIHVHIHVDWLWQPHLVLGKGVLGKCQLSNRCTLLNCTHCRDCHHLHSNLIHRLIVFQKVIRQVSGITVSKYNLPPPGPDFVIVTLYCNDSTDNQKVFSGVFSLCFPCPSAFHLVEAGKASRLLTGPNFHHRFHGWNRLEPRQSQCKLNASQALWCCQDEGKSPVSWYKKRESYQVWQCKESFNSLLQGGQRGLAEAV